MLWDSRFDYEDDSDDEDSNEPEPRTLLATFDIPDGRWIHVRAMLWSISQFVETLFLRISLHFSRLVF